MNKRARVRLIGVTAIILIVVIAIFLGTGSNDGAYYRKVSEIVESDEYVGERVRVGGTVIAGSWNRESDPMIFDIRDEDTESGPTIQVVYNGGVPSTFGDGVVAIVTGEVSADGTLESDDMITKCPSKYESAKDALGVSSLLDRADSMTGTTVKIVGYVTGDIEPPGGETRFSVADTADGSEDLGIFYEGALPAGMETGSQVVIQGALEDDGLFAATEVSLSEESAE